MPAAALLPRRERRARAQLTIDIVGGGAATVPIAVVPFAGENTYPLGISGIDRRRSAAQRPVPAGRRERRRRHGRRAPKTSTWRSGARAAPTRSSSAASPPQADGRVDVRFTLLDAVKQTQLAAYTYVVDAGAVSRHGAQDRRRHLREADRRRRACSRTRIAYIAKQGTRYELFVADADGFNPQSIVASNEPLLSPVWSPDGTRIAYVSFENKKPVVYVQIARAPASARRCANFRGSNSAPAWSPGQLAPRGDADQGRRLADLPDQRRRQRACSG